MTCWLASEIVDAASVMGAASFMQASAVDSSEEAGAAWVGAAALVLASAEGVVDALSDFWPPHAARLSGRRAMSMVAAMRCFMGTPR